MSKRRKIDKIERRIEHSRSSDRIGQFIAGTIVAGMIVMLLCIASEPFLEWIR